MSRPATPELLEIRDDLGAIERVPVVNSVSQKMPALAMRVIKNRGIAVGRRHDQGVCRRRFVQFQTKVVQRRRRGPVERLNTKVRGKRERSDQQGRARDEKHSRKPGTRPDPRAGATREGRRDRDQRKLVPLMAIAVPDQNHEQQHRDEPTVEKPRKFFTWSNQRTEKRQDKQHQRETREHRLPDDLPVPGETHDLKTPGPEKMVRIKLHRDPMGVPVPRRRWNQRHRRENPKLPVKEQLL